MPSDQELLEQLLRIKPSTAEKLLRKYGSYCGVLDRTSRGKLVNEAAARYKLREVEHKPYMTSVEQVKEYLTLKYQGATEEVFSMIYLDGQFRVLAIEALFYGSVTSAHIHPRVVVKKSLEANAAAVILVHNHPSGNPTPSDADKAITYKLKKALHLIEVKLLDHLIVGTSVSSFVERGLLSETLGED